MHISSREETVLTSTTAPEVFEVLKGALKAQGVTYAELARRIGLSEASVKRIFQMRDCKLGRLIEICTVAGVSLGDVVESADRSGRVGTPVSPEVEGMLAQREPLFLFLVLLLDHFTPEGIRRTFDLSRASVGFYMRDLEALGIIERDIGDRFRFTIPTPVQWRFNGPLRPILTRLNQDFLQWTVEHQHETNVDWSSVTRRMRPESAAALRSEITRIAERFRHLSHLDQVTCPDGDLVGMKWISALAPARFDELRRIPKHPDDRDRNR